MAEKPTYEQLQKRVLELEQAERERESALEALRESENLQGVLLENLPAGVIILDSATRVIESVNPAAAFLFGAPQQEIVGHRCYEYYCPVPEGACPVCDLKQKEFNAEGEVVCRDGSRRTVIKYIKQLHLHGKDKILECFVDITQRKRAEESRVKSEAALKKAQGIGRMGNWEWNVATDELYWSDEIFRILKLEVDSTHSELLDSLIHPEDREYVYSSAYDALYNNLPFSIDFRLKLRDDSISWIHDEAEVVYDAEGIPVRMVGIIQDITDRKLAEDALHESQKRYRLLFEGSRDGIVSVDSNGRFIEANRSYCDMLGYSLEELKRMDDFYRITPERWREWEQEEIWNRRLLQQGFTGVYEKEYIRKDGRVFPVELQSFAVFRQSGEIDYLWGIARDITERRQLENNLRQSQKMESVGTLAGGIAHEFNNILAGIIGYAEMSQAEGLAAPDSIEAILTLSYRARDIVKRILAFSREDQPERTALDLHHIIEEAQKVLRATIPATIELRLNLDCKDAIVMGDSTQLYQVIMNLCMNAVHAMDEAGGVLDIGLSPASLDAAGVRQFPDLEPGEYVKLTVSDTGRGINPKIMNRIFDPFFTTKGVGEGTGMGLSVVHGILKEHGGAISVASEHGRGTSFTVLLPKHDDGAAEKEAPKSMPCGIERILLVDDEAFVAHMTQQMLTRLGYRVTAMTESRAMLEAFEKDPMAYDLIITDLTMPHMPGDRLAERISAIRSDIPVVLTTGYGDAVDETSIKQSGITVLLSKPFEMRELARTVRSVLDKRP